MNQDIESETETKLNQKPAFGIETKVKVAEQSCTESKPDIDYNILCEFIEPDKDENVDEPCPYKTFRPKNLRTIEEDEWWREKFRRDKEKRVCLKAKDVVDDEISDEQSCTDEYEEGE